MRKAAAVAARQRTLLGQVNEILLAAFRSRTAYVTAVGLHYPRFWRDLHAMGQHVALNYEASMRNYGRVLMGLEPDSALF